MSHRRSPLSPLRGRVAIVAAVAVALTACFAAAFANAAARLAPASTPAPREPGPLLLIGGGATLSVFPERALALTGGPSSKVVVVPQASREPDAGRGSVEMWREAGATNVERIDLADPARARELLREADVIWMPGGSQSRLVETLADAGLLEDLRRRHAEGALVGGTSAGAAAAPDLMITGLAAPVRLEAGATDTAPGLGLWPGVLVDQHFLKRERWNRFVEAVLAHPDRVGVALAESTGVLVRGDRFEVIGAHNVIVLDARAATVAETEEGAPPAATELRMHVLRDGMRFDLGDER